MLFDPCGDSCRRICTPFRRISDIRQKERPDGDCSALYGGLELDNGTLRIIHHDRRHLFGFAVAVFHLRYEVIKHLGTRIQHIQPARRRFCAEDHLHIGKFLFTGQPLHFRTQFL